ncbi:RDD family protein [Oculatella sp. LEGE 06141]|uniref:RDD family protein n=1 Tax=Oculatella sp. LEGE 06141 TaxID=1828648 RepID=UPI00187FB629|nr:RDD family protein [Oculatella sp. LEGE 06141]MBE9180160.1 RDD family protein [Oculatella sp. LEGE 06141]
MMNNKASFLQRSAAWLIDQAILSIIYSLAAVAIGAVIGAYNNSGIPVPGLIVAPSVIGFSLAPMFGHFLYFGYLWSRRERSIGMGVMNIRVVKPDGHPLSFLMAGLRGSLGYFLSGLIFGLGYLWFFVDKQETWHDKIFNTVVLKQ